jgi:N-acetylglutamate synthase-like GNAT family acetyltransferase
VDQVEDRAMHSDETAPESFAVRTAAAADRDAIRRLLQHLHPQDAGRATLPLIRQESKTFVASDERGVIGLAAVTVVDYGVEAYGMIEELVVEDSRRGEGVGSSLLESCRSWLEDAGARVIFVSALDDAEQFYVGAGFSRCSGPWLYRSPGDQPDDVQGSPVGWVG